MTIKLGQTVRDIVSGLTGIAAAKVEFMTGNVQFDVQPRGTDGTTAPSGLGIDQAQLDVVDDGIMARAITPPAGAGGGIEAGDKVKDLVSGIEGIAVNRVTFLNGCVYFTVQTKANKDGTNNEALIEWKRLSKVSNGLRPTITKKIEALGGKSDKPVGGPATRMLRRQG